MTEVVEIATPRFESNSQSKRRQRNAVMSSAIIILQTMLNITKSTLAPANVKTQPIMISPILMINASLWFSGFSRRYWNFSNASEVWSKNSS